MSPRQAATLAGAALSDTLAAVDAVRPRTKVLCFDGDPSGWLRPGWVHRRQRGGGLDVRLADALATVVGPAMVVGMDTPQLNSRLLDSFDPVRFDACLGPTADGGYWTIGLRDTQYAHAAISGVPMSTDHTYAAQLGSIAFARTFASRCSTNSSTSTRSTTPSTLPGSSPHTAFGAALAGIDSGAA